MIALFTKRATPIPLQRDDDERTKNQVDGMLYLSYFLGACCVLWLALICCIRKRIMLAIGIVKEAARAIAAMPVIVVFPIFQIFGLCVFLVPWFLYCLYLASSGEIKVRDGGAAGSYREFVYDDNTYYAGWYMIFIYYWTSEFIVAIGQLIIAMAVSTCSFLSYWLDICSCGVFQVVLVTLEFCRNMLSVHCHAANSCSIDCEE